MNNKKLILTLLGAAVILAIMVKPGAFLAILLMAIMALLMFGLPVLLIYGVWRMFSKKGRARTARYEAVHGGVFYPLIKPPVKR